MLAKSFSKLQSAPSFHTCLKGDYVNSFSLFLTSAEEICNTVAIMPPKTSAGYDEISMQVMKITVPYIAAPPVI